MRTLLTMTASAFLLTTLAVTGHAGGDLKSYLTPDGKLKHTLTIKDVQGGFAGFTGKMWKVEPNGKWTEYQVFNKKLTAKNKGMLKETQLKKLAEHLAKYDALKLKNLGKATVNPHVLTIRFGKHKGVLTLRAGSPLPKQDTKALAGRFGGIARAVQAMLK